MIESVSMKELQQRWKTFYGSAPPVTHLLRDVILDRWLRIHSLPESKRYAETPDEYSILLLRHNTVATEVLGSQTPCLLLVGRYAEHSEVDIHSQILPQLQSVRFALFTSLIDPTEPDLIINVWYALVVWSSNQFDNIIKAVADGNEANILFVSLETGEAYAPYDGGADLFLISSERQSQLKQQFRQWLSKHPQGL